jgi:apolipoprotein N-acyltransferase
MNFKSYLKLGILSIVICTLSFYNLVFSVWSIILIILSWFIVNNRDAVGKSAQDKKVLGFIQTFMLGVFIFMSTVMGGIGIYLLHYPISNDFSSFMILFIILAAAGLIIYYYFVVRLLKESIRVIKNKGSTP